MLGGSRRFGYFFVIKFLKILVFFRGLFMVELVGLVLLLIWVFCLMMRSGFGDLSVNGFFIGFGEYRGVLGGSGMGVCGG